MNHTPELAHAKPDLGIQNIIPNPLDLPFGGGGVPNFETVRPTTV
jgi:hypothetical protein